MRRRQFITLVAGATTWPLYARAQQSTKPKTIGFMFASTAAAEHIRRVAFVQRLGELGWIDGRDVIIEYRSAEGAAERAGEIAAEFIQLKVDVMVMAGDAQTLAAKRATDTIPIVFAGASDPVGNGLVASLARPGGNITGLSGQVADTAGKRIELLHDLIPALHRLAIFGNFANPNVAVELEAAQAAARALNLDIVRSGFRRAEDIPPAIESPNLRADALYVCVDPLAIANRVSINTLALRMRLPTIHSYRDNLEGGGLLSYGTDVADLYRRAASLVDKVLRGAKPADLPVEQPTKFDLVINLKTAKALGLAVPPTLLALADEVIE